MQLLSADAPVFKQTNKQIIHENIKKRASKVMIHMIWAFPIHTIHCHFLMESFHNVSWNGVLIVERKENTEAGAICFEEKVKNNLVC